MYTHWNHSHEVPDAPLPQIMARVLLNQVAVEVRQKGGMKKLKFWKEKPKIKKGRSKKSEMTKKEEKK